MSASPCPDYGNLQELPMDIESQSSLKDCGVVGMVKEDWNQNEMEEQDMLDDGSTASFTCIICHKQFLQDKDVSDHELKVHFAWTIKPYNLTLLRHFISILRDGSKNDSYLRAELEATLAEFENCYDKDVKCLECDFFAKRRNELIEHFKINHILCQDFDRRPHDQNAMPIDACEESNDAESYQENNDSNQLNNCEVVEQRNDENGHGKWDKSGETEKQGSSQNEKRHKTYLNYACGYCKQIFKDSKTLNWHVMTQHFKDLRCHLCPFAADKKARKDCRALGFSTIRKHLQSRHRLTLCGRRGIPCPHCDFLCLSPRDLSAHRSRFHSNLRSLASDLTFSADKDLESHRALMHQKSSSIRCPSCPTVFIHSKAAFKRHVSQSINHVEICQDCGLPIPSVDKRNGRHECPVSVGQTRDSSKSSITNDTASFHCPNCSFASNRQYMMHRHTSLMHKRQSCPSDSCDFALENRIQLQSHIKECHGEMCHVCAYVKEGEGDTHLCAEYLLLPIPDKRSNSCVKVDNPMIAELNKFAKPRACEKCRNVFVNDRGFEKHLANVCNQSDGERIAKTY